MVMDTTSCRNQPTNDATVTLPTSMLKEFRGIAIQHLIDLMTRKLQAGTATESDQWWTVPNQAGWLDVRVNHMIDDYRWVESLPASLNDSGQLETDVRQVPAPAVLRIQGSRNHLPYTPNASTKLTGSP